MSFGYLMHRLLTVIQDEQRELIRKRHGITEKEKWYHGIVASVCCAFPLTQHSEQIALEEGRGVIV